MPNRPGHPRKMLLIGMSLLFAAINMRPALSSLSVLLGEITSGLAISATVAGLLTMLPSLCFGIAALGTLPLAGRLRSEATIVGALLCLALALSVRLLGSIEMLFLSTILATLSIGVLGAIVPGFIKQEFPASVGIATGFYTTVMCGGGALAAAVTVPIEHVLGLKWNSALAAWAILPLAGALCWLPWAYKAGRLKRQRVEQRLSPVWTSSLGWMVTGFMAFQAAMAFIVLGWLPTILHGRGYDPTAAGFLTSISVLSQTATALVIPAVAGRMRRQRGLVFGCVLAAVLGFAGVTLGPLDLRALWAVLLGLGQGGNFGLALVFIGLRSAGPSEARGLAIMSQGIGYSVAALGPLVCGWLWQADSKQSTQVLFFAGLGVVAIIFGIASGTPSNRDILDTQSRPTRG